MASSDSPKSDCERVTKSPEVEAGLVGVPGELEGELAQTAKECKADSTLVEGYREVTLQVGVTDSEEEQDPEEEQKPVDPQLADLQKSFARSVGVQVADLEGLTLEDLKELISIGENFTGHAAVNIDAGLADRLLQ